MRQEKGKTIRSILLLLAVCLHWACANPTSDPSPEAPVNSPTAEAADSSAVAPSRAEPNIVEAIDQGKRAYSEGVEVWAYGDALSVQLELENFDVLEAELARIRSGDSRFTSPHSKLFVFYRQLDSPRRFGENAYTSEWLDHLYRLRAWMAAYPDSQAAKVIAARALTHVSRFRSGLSRYPVALDDWLGMPARTAGELLRRAQESDAPKDAAFYDAWMLYLGPRGDAKRLEEMLNRALELDPGYYPALGTFLDYMSRQEKPEVAVRVLRAHPEMIAMVVPDKLSSFRGPGLAADEVFKSYEGLRKDYPGSAYVLTRYAWAAVDFDDKERAKKLYSEIGDRNDALPWTNLEYMGWGRTLFGNDWKPEAKEAIHFPELDPLARRPEAVETTLTWQLDLLWVKGRYAEIEALAQRWATDGSKLPGGMTRSSFLLDNPSVKFAESRRQEYFRQFPESVWARTLALDYLVGLAYKSRGREAAREVSQKQWEGFYKELGQAREIFDQGFHQDLSHPVKFYASGIRIANGLGLDRKFVDLCYQKALQTNDDPAEAAVAMGFYLLPRWHGRAGDVETFANSEFEAGRRHVYYLIRRAYKVMTPPLPEFEDDKLVAGAVDFAERLGGVPGWSEVADFAWKLDRREVARSAFEHLGKDWSPAHFHSRRRYEAIRAWAMGRGQRPVFKEPTEDY